jgi:hypothetical protein
LLSRDNKILNRLHSVYFFLFVIFPILIFLSFNKHKGNYIGTYHDVIWADAAGYYIYLPYWFIYGDNVNRYPDSILSKTGKGFFFNNERRGVQTKYTCGVALLQMPFFLLAHLTSRVMNLESNGFSRQYHWAIFIAAAFYCSLGLYFLNKFLRAKFNDTVSLVSTFAIFLATNLYYYAIDNGGMSHVYSFFLVSFLLYSLNIYYYKRTVSAFILPAFLSGLIFLTRPINIFILLIVFFYSADARRNAFDSIKYWITNYRLLLLFILIVSAVFLPQLIYWHHISGKWFYDSYTDETFSNWKRPQLIKVWFSTQNGLFTYAPILLLSITGTIIMVYNKIANAVLILLVFSLSSYAFASWWSWYFGCSFGARNFVDYLPIFSIPLAFLFLNASKNYQKYLLASFIVTCIAVNFSFVYYYSGCFEGGDWNWNAYLIELLK